MTQETTLGPLSDSATKELLQRRKDEEKLLRKLKEVGLSGYRVDDAFDMLLVRMRTARRLLLEAKAAQVKAESALADANSITLLLTQERIEIEVIAKSLNLSEPFNDFFGAPKNERS